MNTQPYELSKHFFSIVSQSDAEGQGLLLADHSPSDSPQKLFLLRYAISGVASAESGRPIFKSEVTGYDYQIGITYPTQREGLDELQTLMETNMYASSEAKLVRTLIRDTSTGQERPMKIIISQELVVRISGLYRYAW